MRVAVIGSGISGLATAWLLSRKHEVTLYEAEDYFGGHTHTHQVELIDGTFAVDSGFIVYNPLHYPLLTGLFAELGIASQSTTMSFAVRSEASGLEYNAGSLNGLFAQRRNLVSPRFLGMVGDLLRFYRQAPRVLHDANSDLSLEEYLAKSRYGAGFRDDHIVPMAAALWSCPSGKALAFPIRHLVQFMLNHQMLQVTGRQPWRVVTGGSCRYVAALRARWSVRERLSAPVRQVRRAKGHVQILGGGGIERFDHVVLACHSDQALALLVDASAAERAVLGAIRYQANEAILHSDVSVLPTRRALWGAWNVLISGNTHDCCTVSYCMNLLQGLATQQPLIVSLNAGGRVDPRRIIKTMRYEHPIFSREAVSAQKRKAEIQGIRRTWYAGAYWGWGFHEDGMRSAVAVAREFGIEWPVPTLSGHDADSIGAQAA